MNSPDNDTEFDPFANDPVKKKSNGSSGGARAGIAWLALLMGLAAIAYNAYQWWQGQSADTDDRSRQLAITGLQQTQAGFQQSLESLQGRLVAQEENDDSAPVAAIRSDINAMQVRLSEFGLEASADHALIEAIQFTLLDMGQRISDVESSVAALAVRSDSPGKRMDLAEVDYLLRLAGERLALFGDTGSADIALGLADTHLQALDDPLYLPVRRRIAESRSALQQIPSLDIVQISSQIAALQSSIPDLSFPGEIPLEVLVEDQADAGLWQRVKNAIKPLVKVRRRVDESQDLSLEDKDYLRQALWLQLESARLALMRKDALVWDLSLSRARDGVSSRFDPGSKAVREALDRLNQLTAIELVQELPDVRAAWRQLRLLREGRVKSEPTNSTTNETATSDLPVIEEPVGEIKEDPQLESTEDDGDPAG